MQKLQSIISVLQEIATLFAQYGPVALQIEQLVVAGDWPGVIALLESLLSPPAPAPANQTLTPSHRTQVQAMISKLKTATA